METQSSIIDWNFPKHPSFSIYGDRVNSFKINNWPVQLCQTPEELSIAGLFYEGRSDLTICYFCSGGIHRWEESDVPLLEHATHFPNCGYIKLLRSNREGGGDMLPRRYNRYINNFRKICNRFSSLLNSRRLFEHCTENAMNESDDNLQLQVQCVCKLCFSREAEIVLLPCSHISTCKCCTLPLNKCPICRININQVVKVYFA